MRTRISESSRTNALFLRALLLLSSILLPLTSVFAEDEIPPGFHRMPNGEIMANNPSTAVAPEGYRLTENGILKKAGEAENLDTNEPDARLTTADAASKETEADTIPPGFHRMPDGTLMANSPSNAKVPPGYHMMPDGTLMKNSGGMDHSAHHAHAGGHHHHGAGMWMFDYKYMRMYMEDLLDTTNKVTPEQIISKEVGDYSMSPIDMTMDMHMFMAMYGFTDKVMGMLMLHYMSNSMSMYGGTIAQPAFSTMETSGMGDTIVSAMIQGPANFTFEAGLSIPTGAIDNTGPMTHAVGDTEENVRYPYGMQLGSGTYDLIVGVDYNKSMGNSAWGAEYEYVLRNGTNDEGYTLGDKMLVGGWAKFNLTPSFEFKTLLQFNETGRIEGEDRVIRDAPRSNKFMSPTMDAGNYGGRRLDLGIGVKYQTQGMVSVGAEYKAPIYQNLFGPQMATKWIASVNVGVMF